jgi:hypothetical protein
LVDAKGRVETRELRFESVCIGVFVSGKIYIGELSMGMKRFLRSYENDKSIM